MSLVLLGFVLLGLVTFWRRPRKEKKLVFRTDQHWVRLQQDVCSLPLENIKKVSAFVAAKLNSPLLFCPRSGRHVPYELCFSLTVMDPESLDIMVKLLDHRLNDAVPTRSRHHVSHVLDVAEYLLLREHYLESIIPQYFLSDPLGARFNPHFLLSVRDLYWAGYTSLAKTLYILWDSREPRALSVALKSFPHIFDETDFFWG